MRTAVKEVVFRSAAVWVIFTLLFLCTGCCCFVAFCLPDLYDRVHVCPKCDKVI